MYTKYGLIQTKKKSTSGPSFPTQLLKSERVNHLKLNGKQLNFPEWLVKIAAKHTTGNVTEFRFLQVLAVILVCFDQVSEIRNQNENAKQKQYSTKRVWSLEKGLE